MPYTKYADMEIEHRYFYKNGAERLGSLFETRAVYGTEANGLYILIDEGKVLLKQDFTSKVPYFTTNLANHNKHRALEILNSHWRRSRRPIRQEVMEPA